MNNSMYNKFGTGFLLLSAVFMGYAAYTLATADGSEGLSSRGSPVANSFLPKANAASSGPVREESITLSKSNTVMFRSVVGPSTVAKTQQELLEKSKALPSGKPIYLVLDTPGGDINAGNLLIDTARGLGRPVHTITTFAASMGFAFVQRLGKRYVTPSGTLMAHRARISGIEGQIPGEALTAVAFVYNIVTKMEKQNAARLGISFETYTALVKDEYWVTGEDAVAQNAADAIANIQCDDSLSGTNQVSFDTLFGPVQVTFSNCPAIQAPLGVKFQNETDETKRVVGDYNRLRRTLAGGTIR